jgi:two-component system sensor histidine kinase GlrK
MIEAVLLTATALLMAALFTALITRPLRLIDHAIHRLGDGSLATPVNVRGPRDVEELGTRLEWLRTRLKELEAQRVAFLRHVSHELKTPLTSIQEGVALLGERVVGPLNEQQGEITGILRNQCRRLARLIDELLRFNLSRLSAPGIEPRVVRLDNVVERVLSDHSLALQNGRLRVAAQLDTISVRGDPDRLRVIVDNLLTNAIKFSPSNAVIAIGLRRNGDRAVLEVGDEGPGIPAEERTLVFEPYYQGKPPDKRRFRGTGLGLAITRDYVESSGGDIEILDAARGALFRVRLPAVEARPA